MPFSIWRLLSSRGFSPRFEVGRGMITILIWNKAYINLCITYFNIELKRNTINFPHRQQTYGYKWSISFEGYQRKHQQICPHWAPTFSKRQLSWVGVTSWDPRGAWYRVISVLPRYLPMGWYRYGTSGVYVWAKLTLLFINMW